MTPSLLIEQVIYWIQHTKNKMKDLNYDHSLYYSLKEKHKSLEIKFITDHNYKKKSIYNRNTLSLSTRNS